LQYLISTTLTGPSNAVLGASLYTPHWQINQARFSDEDTRSRRATLDDSDRRCLESRVSLLLPIKERLAGRNHSPRLGYMDIYVGFTEQVGDHISAI